MSPHDIGPAIERATGEAHPLDDTFIDDEGLASPWQRKKESTKKLSGPLPQKLTVTLANLIYLEKTQLSQPLSTSSPSQNSCA